MDENTFEIVLPDTTEQIEALQKQVDALKVQNDEIYKLLKSPRKLVRDANGRITGSVIE